MVYYLADFEKSFAEFDKIVIRKYEEIPLYYIMDVDFEGQNAIQLFSKSTHNKKTLKPFNWFEAFEEIRSINKDIKYFTCLLYLLRPYINRPIDEGGRYFQTVCDKRYLTFASVVHQCAYNYWDRIGDLLHVFFETGLKERDVYFNRVLQNIPGQFKESENHVLLTSLYESTIKRLLDNRRLIVHHKQIESKMYTGTFLHRDDPEKLGELQKEKESYPEFFKKQLEVSVQGYESALGLIGELPVQ